MAFSSGAFGQLRYCVESVIGTTPAVAGINLRQVGPTMKASVTTTSSKEVRQDRLSTGLTRTDLNIDGGFKFELSAKEYDPFLEGIVGSAMTHYGTLGLGTVFGLTTAALLVTAAVAPTTTSAFSLLVAGSWFKIVPPVGATAAQKLYFADAWFKVASTTTTTIVLDASTPIAAAGLGITAVAGYAVSQSTMINGAAKKGFTLEYALTDIAQFLPFQGMQVNTLDLDVQVGSIITGTMGFMGNTHSGMVASTTFTGGPVASQAFDVMNAVADVGVLRENGASLLSAGSFIKSIKLQISNNMRAQKAVGVFGNAGVGFGELSITGTLELFVQDATYYNRWFQGTNTSLEFGFADSAGNGYLFELDKVSFKDGGLNPGDQSSDVMLSLPFQAFYNAATGRGLRVTRGVVA